MATTAVEQLLGRVLRQPGASHRQAKALNQSYAFVVSRNFAETAGALLPAILGGFKKQAQAQPAGLDGLGGLLGQLGGGGLLDQVLAPQPTDVSQGNDVLGQIFGSKDVSRTVAQNAASQTGLDPALLEKMLPMLAMLVAGSTTRTIRNWSTCNGRSVISTFLWVLADASHVTI